MLFLFFFFFHFPTFFQVSNHTWSDIYATEMRFLVLANNSTERLHFTIETF